MTTNAAPTAGPDESELAQGAVLLATVLTGLLAMVVMFALDPFGAPVVLTSWCLLLGGLLLAVVPDRTRRVGFGLVLAGLVPPLFVFSWIWVLLSAGILTGSVH